MVRKVGGCVLCSVLLLSACDKGSDNTVPPTPPPVQVPVAQVRPTTQQLENRSNLNLKYVPLSLMVPDGWQVKSYGVGTDDQQEVLEGPTLSDDIRFRIALPRKIKGDDPDPRSIGNQEKALEQHANEMAAKHPEWFNGPVVRDIGGAKVIDQLAIRDLQPTTEELALNPHAATQPIHTVQWTFTVVVPAGPDFTAYDLTASMTLSQYKADSAFVRSIMDTLKYTPSPTDATIH